MAVVSRIGVWSAFKVALVVYGLLGLLAGLLCTSFAFAAPTTHAALVPWAGRLRLFALILCPVVYGLFGAITTVIAVLIYNIASRRFGGLELELK